MKFRLITLGIFFFGLGFSKPGDRPVDLDALIASKDQDGDGALDFSEFCQLRKTQNLSESVAQGLFERFDKNGDQKIEAKELSLEKHRPRGPVLENIFGRWDLDNNHYLSEEEFNKLHGPIRRLSFDELDLNDDGQLALAELVKSLPKHPENAERPGPHGPRHGGEMLFPHDEMELIDADLDRLITREELTLALSSGEENRSAKRLQKWFSAIDLDADNSISEDEVQAYSRAQSRDDRPPRR